VSRASQSRAIEESAVHDDRTNALRVPNVVERVGVEQYQIGTRALSNGPEICRLSEKVPKTGLIREQHPRWRRP
jgi:hypothetical protein